MEHYEKQKIVANESYLGIGTNKRQTCADRNTKIKCLGNFRLNEMDGIPFRIGRNRLIALVTGPHKSVACNIKRKKKHSSTVMKSYFGKKL